MQHKNGRNLMHISRGYVESSSMGLIKKGIWFYVLLLIFEGAIRKWILPDMSGLLLIIRDPFAIYLIFLTWKNGLLPANVYLTAAIFVGILSIFIAILFGHGSIPVALYGARILLVHFPLIFVIGSIFNKNDVLAIGKFLLWLSIPMAILITVQFLSPQSAWVNRGIGGDLDGAGFQGALGYLRPPATFSFTSGTHLFFGLVACYCLYFWLTPGKVNRLILIMATIGLIVAIPFSISRSLTFHMTVSLVFALIAVINQPSYFNRTIILCCVGIILLLLLNQISFFQIATEAFFARFEQAGKAEGGVEGTLGKRYFGGMFNSIIDSMKNPVLGYGIGMGTNVGSMILTGKMKFLIAEEEWARVIGELGPLLGLGVIAIRLGLALKLTKGAYNRLKTGEILPWMILSYTLLIIPQGQWAQPTILGFSIVAGGLTIASTRNSE